MEPNKPKNKWLHVRIDASVHEDLSKAATHDMSVSDIVRKVVYQFLYGRKNQK